MVRAVRPPAVVGVVRVNAIYVAEIDEARAARNAMTEMDRAPRHPYAHDGMCGDRDDARDERP